MREETAFVVDVFCIYFHHHACCLGMARHIVDKGFIPRLVLDFRVGYRCVLCNLVEMPEHIEASAFEHSQDLFEIFLNDITEIAAKGILEITQKPVRASVAVHRDAILVRDEMHRPDAVVERHTLEHVYMRSEVN